MERCTFLRLSLAAAIAAALLPAAAAAIASGAGEFEAALRATPDAERGRRLFAARCQACHEDNGAGSADGIAPAIAGQHFSVIVRQLYDYRQDRRWDLRMEHLTGGEEPLSSQDVADVASFISALPPVRTAGFGTGVHARHGERLYRRSCAGCHGEHAEGSGERQVPRLAGQNFQYLLRQLHDAVEHRRPNFPPEHVKLLSPLVVDDLEGLSDYLSRLAP